MDNNENNPSALMIATQNLDSPSIQELTDSPYRPLNSQAEEIRVATLASGNYDDPFVIHLSILSLSQSAHPKYEALSYVWGQGTSPHKAMIDGKAMTIGENLDCALRHLRYQDEARVLWIDALCINQADILERNSQVQLMGHVYSTAHSVAIWLGPGDEDDAEVVRNIKRVTINWDFRTLGAFVRICERPWFRRVWVIQEFAMGNGIRTLYIGQSSLPWDLFHNFVTSDTCGMFSNMWDCDDQRRSRLFSRFRQAEYQIRNLETMKRDKNLGIPVYYFRNSAYFAATNDRDKVYGILGLATSFDNSFGITPDYKKSVQEVFIDAISLLVQEAPAELYSFHPLHAMRNDDGTIYPTLNGLPSWVMDLTITTRQLGTNHAYNMPRTFSQHMHLESSNTRMSGLDTLVHVSQDNALRAAGTYIDTIVEISQDLILKPSKDKQAPEHSSRSENIMRKIYNNILRPRNIPPETLWNALHPGIDIDGYADTSLEEHADIPLDVQENILFVTKGGRVGISYHPDAIQGIRSGDVVVGLFGANLPFILRPAELTEEYKMVNVAYVANHNYVHSALENAPEGTTQDDVWNDLKKFGLQEFIIV
jgi:hypothetical protein